MCVHIISLTALLLWFAPNALIGGEESPARFEFSWDYRPVGGELQTVVIEKQASSDDDWAAHFLKQSRSDANPRTEEIISSASCAFSVIDITCQTKDGGTILRVLLNSEIETRVSVFVDTLQPDYSLRRRSLGLALLQIQPSRTLSEFVTPFSMTNGSVERIWLARYKLNPLVPQHGVCPEQIYALKHDLNVVGLGPSQNYTENLQWIINDDQWPSHFKETALNNLDYFIFSIARSNYVPFQLPDLARYDRYLISTISADRLSKQARIVNPGSGSDQKMVMWEISRKGDNGIWLRNETYTQTVKSEVMTTLTSLFCAYDKD